MIYTQEITIKGREMLPKWGGNSARLNMFNCLKTGHPIEPKGTEGYRPIRGWKCLGYAQAPYKGCESHAVIYDYSGEVFWAHGAADMPVECEANCGAAEPNLHFKKP